MRARRTLSVGVSERRRLRNFETKKKKKEKRPVTECETITRVSGSCTAVKVGGAGGKCMFAEESYVFLKKFHGAIPKIDQQIW